MDSFPYCIPCQRELTSEESDLVRYIVENNAPQRLSELGTLKVIARCGCGKCPTILFGSDLNEKPNTKHPVNEIAEYYGLNSDGVTVGIILFVRDERLSELEAWSPKGEDIASWPKITSLTKNINNL